MTDDQEAPKSAYELAMERLRAQDEKEGRTPPTPLTDEQKEAIAEIRRRYEAKTAEAKILQEPALRKAREAGDPEKLKLLEEEHGRELIRLEEEREREIARVRSGGDVSR